MQQISLSEAIRQRRLELGLSQEQVCEGICEPPTLSRLENGKQTMTHNRIKALMQRLNMPDDRYYGLLTKHEMELDNAKRELYACGHWFMTTSAAQKPQAREMAMVHLNHLEALAEDDDTITRQCIIKHRVLLGTPDGPYPLDEQLEMLLGALRLTVPRFSIEKLSGRRYSREETELITQIAGVYSHNGMHAEALNLYSELYDYVSKHDDQLSIYAAHFTLTAHNYARELGIQKYYHKSIEIAEQGKQMSIKYGYYQFLPGLLYIAGECYYRLGAVEQSKELCLQAHYLYKVLEDAHNLRLLDRDIKNWFNIEFPA